jgi:formamidopyrimidine-DNA glycosylase
MPELPEVQTIVNDLNKKIIGKTIIGFWSDWSRRVKPDLAKFKALALKAKIIKISRKGKQIILELDNNCSILIHLKIAGHLLYKPLSKQNISVQRKNPNKKNGQHIHHIFYFTDKSELGFLDIRKFGWLKIVKTKDVQMVPEISRLGIDALDPKLTFKEFNELCDKKGKSKIGTTLLDQKWITGIGNIYRNEILFNAKIHPLQTLENLTEVERKRIYKSMRAILKKAIQARGTTDADYRDTAGKKGGYQKFLKVYRKTGQPCYRCKGIIKKIKLGQRSVFFCPKCQKLKTIVN